LACFSGDDGCRVGLPRGLRCRCNCIWCHLRGRQDNILSRHDSFLQGAGEIKRCNFRFFLLLVHDGPHG